MAKRKFVDNENHVEAFFTLAKIGYWSGMKDMIEAGKVRIDAQNHNNETILHIAVSMCYYQFMQSLLDYPQARILLEIKDWCGRTPLSMAALKGDANAVALLVKSDASLNTKDNFGRTPWDAAQLSENQELIDFLEALVDDRHSGREYAHVPKRKIIEEVQLDNDSMNSKAQDQLMELDDILLLDHCAARSDGTKPIDNRRASEDDACKFISEEHNQNPTSLSSVQQLDQIRNSEAACVSPPATYYRISAPLTWDNLDCSPPQSLSYSDYPGVWESLNDRQDVVPLGEKKFWAALQDLEV